MSNHIASAETILDPSLPIVDPHHHLWMMPQATVAAARAANSPFRLVMSNKSRYLLEELLADINTGHNVRATVCVVARAMYRAHAPEAMKSLGEIEFLTGAAAMAGSGLFGDVKVCAGLVGNVNLNWAMPSRMCCTLTSGQAADVIGAYVSPSPIIRIRLSSPMEHSRFPIFSWTNNSAPDSNGCGSWACCSTCGR